MKNRKFSYFQSHIDLAHMFWKKHVTKDAIIVDATCGNGHDSLYLASECLHLGHLFCIDLQKEAIASTEERLASLTPSKRAKITLIEGSHVSFETLDCNCDLFVYNLGYLPGETKHITTMVTTTLKSVKNALKRLNKGGLISITCYPGHEEGKKEESALLSFFSGLCPSEYMLVHNKFMNRNSSPSLLLVYKST
ncbi:rRNA methyltransferase [Candidatus Aerophobetes bacterium]|uniref:rRNA methyltransferase n=1 Tax=Aerophobetes bacterium TaxID=2030807 RepID=A0A2A4YDN0_UNCAE|nr:MAG: rRNA methyltransferase [Candidatus Aerophobetes bacterium]